MFIFLAADYVRSKRNYQQLGYLSFFDMYAMYGKYALSGMSEEDFDTCFRKQRQLGAKYHYMAQVGLGRLVHMCRMLRESQM